jgi:hypothetical protein
MGKRFINCENLCQAEILGNNFEKGAEIKGINYRLAEIAEGSKGIDCYIGDIRVYIHIPMRRKLQCRST